MADSKGWLKIVFSLVSVLMLVAFTYISVVHVIRFLSHPIATWMEVDIETQKFPRITFCNENPLKRSIVESLPEFVDIKRLITQFDRIVREEPTQDDFQINMVRSLMLRQKLARVSLRFLMAKLSEQSIRAAGYNWTETVAECTYNGRTCDSTNFTSFVHPEFGVCWTFEVDQTVQRPGRKQGLRLLMTVNQNAPGGRFDFLPSTDSASIKAVVHNEGDMPDFVKNGFRATVGTQTLVGLSRVDYRRYGTCADHGPDTRYYYQNYTYSAAQCQHSCLQWNAARICGCTDPQFLKDASHSYCESNDDRRCVMSLAHTIGPATGRNVPVCECPQASIPIPSSLHASAFLSPVREYPHTNLYSQACTETVYKRVVSVAVFPSDKYLVATGTQAQREALLGAQDGGRKGECNDAAQEYDDQQSCAQGTTQPTTSTTTTSTSTTDASTTTSTSTATTTLTTSEQATTTALKLPSDWNTCPLPKAPGANPSMPGVDTSNCTGAAGVFANDNFTLITGWPCLSTKRCQTCVMAKKWTTKYAWPCKYAYSGDCQDHFWASQSDMTCNEFFRDFDFIPRVGTQSPTFDWATAGQVSCDKDASSKAAVSALSNQLLAPEFAALITNQSVEPCKLAAIARFAGDHRTNADMPAAIGTIPGVGTVGRRKRSAAKSGYQATSSPPVDLPGYGSCEYANKNFVGAAECHKWYRRNGLVLRVYFDSLTITKFNQAADYPLVALLSDISGHAGLWLGFSVVTLVEIVLLLAFCLCYCCCGKRIRVMDEDVLAGMGDRDDGDESARDNAV